MDRTSRIKERGLMVVSWHYEGRQGDNYAAWQLRAADELGAEAARRFRSFCNAEDVCLDFGCGGGSILANLDVRQRVGVEPNMVPRELALSRGVEVVSALHQVEDESVDVVISNHALEHCREPFQELSGMRRVLRPGGRMVLILPLEDWRRSRRYRGNDRNRHLYAWNPLLIGNLVDDAGFVVQRCEIVRHAYPPGVGYLWRVFPERSFDVVCGITSVVTRMRQIRLVAFRK